MKDAAFTVAPSLVPTGTARGLFHGTAGTAVEDPDQKFLHRLGDPLRARDVSDGSLLLAWEATRWAPDATPPERHALGCLVVALCETVEAGGTFLPLTASPSTATATARPDAGLASSLGRLGLGETDRAAVLNLGARLAADTAPPALAPLFGPPGARRPFIVSDGALYPERLWAAEAHLVSLLRARLARTPSALPGRIDDALAHILATPGATPLADEQTAAVRAALAQPLTVVAGGPGSGKTSIVVALLRTLGRLGVPADQVALAAPTGRAAQRILESVNTALATLHAPAESDLVLTRGFGGATTLHRLLGIRSGRLRGLEADAPTFFSEWRLPHRVVVVDEASMIDLVLMGQLVAAVADDARLILLGDPDQLPSVQVGAVFRELVAGAPVATRRLARSHRMSPEDPSGAEILRVATAVNTDGAIADDNPILTRASDLRLEGFERLAARQLGGFLDRWHREVLAGERVLASALDHRFTVGDGELLRDHDDGEGGGGNGGNVAIVKTLLGTHAAARILCVTRTAGRATSSDAVNRVLHGRVVATAVTRGAGGALAFGDAFVPGEPVIVLHNDYGRELYNGDLGVVLRMHGPRGEGGDYLGVAFARSDGIVAHPLDDLDGNVALAFALTVHKAQGSEYDRVALVLPQTDVPLLSREILYTALSRARRGVVVIGDPALFALGAGRTLDRTSGIARGLSARVG